jgi:hypothetical protein
MVGHQHVRVYLTPVPLPSLPNPAKVGPIIVVIEKHRLSVVAPLYHVDRYTR